MKQLATSEFLCIKIIKSTREISDFNSPSAVTKTSHRPSFWSWGNLVHVARLGLEEEAMLQWGEEEVGKRLKWLWWTQGGGEHITHMAKLGVLRCLHRRPQPACG